MFKSIVRTASAVLSAVLAFSLVPAVSAAPQPVSRLVRDYTGAGSVIALIGAGFAADHPVFAEAPLSPALTEEEVAAILPEAYVSARLAAVWDYADGDADVSNSSFVGTAAASLAAGRYTGRGDITQEDGTVQHDASFAGSAPDAQLLLFKAAGDYSVRIQAAAAAQAVRDAVLLGADVIWLDTQGLEAADALLQALEKAREASVPVLVGTGDITDRPYIPEQFPVTYTDRGTLNSWARIPGITVVGAARDPYAAVTSFLLTRGEETTEIPYTDSCPDYFSASFASLMAGDSLRLVPVPGAGRPSDYASVDAAGAVAVVLRGEIPFIEKAQYAAEAGAVALIVADNGSGLSRMALEGAPIPAVMVEEKYGEMLFAQTDAGFSVPAAQPRPAAFSASGISEDLLACPAFLCTAQHITAAIPPTETASYASVSGTGYAAACAAGYIARAAEYDRAAGLGSGQAMALAMSSVQPITDEEGDRLSPREVGCGLLSADGSYGSAVLSDTDTGCVSLPGDLLYSSAILSLHLTNPTAETQRYTVTVSVLGESSTDGEDGVPYLTGGMEPLDGFSAYMGDSYVNICRNSSGSNAGIITLKPGEKTEFTVRIAVTAETRRTLMARFWNGFFADGAVTVSDMAGGSVQQPFSLFFGDWESAPLCDVSVYDGTDAVIRENMLYVCRFDEDGTDYRLPLGAASPYSSMTRYDESYNLVNPALLRYGWAELELYALRDIDHMEITFYDSRRHTVLSRSLPGVRKYLTGGEAKIPLWDFIAVDESDYLFPDGEYSCEIRLSSSFGAAGDAVQYLGFSFTVDSEKPQVTSLQVSPGEHQVLLTVEAEDNAALLDVAVYDTVFSYGVTGKPAVAGEKTVTLTFDVTQYDAMSPLYIEITDRAGSYTTVRLSPEQFEDLLSTAHAGGNES